MPSAFQTAAARRLFYRRCTIVVLLGTFVITAAGVPLPGGKQVYESEGQFPCAASSCGCRTAEHCWRSCCCHSFAERIAWARKHGVPPAGLRRRAGQDGRPRFELARKTRRGDFGLSFERLLRCPPSLRRDRAAKTAIAKSTKSRSYLLFESARCSADAHERKPASSYGNR